MKEPLLTDAHKHSSNNVEEVKNSTLCGCFYCRRIYAASVIEEFIDNGQTALCPYCGVDAVIGDASGYVVTDDFLTDMYSKWFSIEMR